MLIVVHNGDLHLLAQLLLDVKAFGRFDIFQVDAAESRLQRFHDLHEFLRVLLVDLDIEHIDVCEYFEQYALSFHHGLTGLGADIAQSEHGSAIADHR